MLASRIMLFKHSIGMKTSIFSYGYVSLPVFCLCATLGCKPARETDIAGQYTRQGQGITDSLFLSPDSYFTQYIRYTNGTDWSITGAWKLKFQVIEFDRFFSVFDFENNSVAIPPKLVAIQTLRVEKNKLIKNDYEPAWERRTTH